MLIHKEGKGSIPVWELPSNRSPQHGFKALFKNLVKPSLTAHSKVDTFGSDGLFAIEGGGRDNTTRVYTLIHMADLSGALFCCFPQMQTRPSTEWPGTLCGQPWRATLTALAHIGLGPNMLRWILSL